MSDYFDSTDWLVAAVEVYKELNEVYGVGHGQLAKRKRTLEAMVEAELAGRSQEDVFRLDDTCSRNIWFTKWGKDRVMLDALKALKAAMVGIQDSEVILTLAESKRRLAMLTPDAVTELERSVKSGEESISLRAALAILDRADYATAEKSGSKVEMMGPLEDEELRAFREWRKTAPS